MIEKNLIEIFSLVILLVVILSILSNNIIWWVFVLIVAWGYTFYITKTNNITKMITWREALQIWKQAFPYKNLSWFVLEYHIEKNKIHNIVIIDDKNAPRIYTIEDTEKNLKNFVSELNWYIPMLENYNQTTLDKLIRKLKL